MTGNPPPRVAPDISTPSASTPIHSDTTTDQLQSETNVTKQCQQVAPEIPQAVTILLTEIEQASQTCLEDLQAAGVWRNGSVLKFHFMNDDRWARGRHKVSHVVQSNWERYANIKFDFLNEEPNAEIRIKFGTPHSFVLGSGTRCLLNDNVDEPTMGLSFDPDDFTWCSEDEYRVHQPILHE